MTQMNTLKIADFEKYSEAHTKPIHPILEELKERTIAVSEYPQMMVGNLEGKLLQLVCALSNASRVVEVGTFTGYSTLCLADAVGPNGEVLTIDVNPETTAIAKEFVDRAGLGDRVTFAIGSAAEVIDGVEGPIDFAFIDADKSNYDVYYELLLPKLKTTGFILFDNMLWGGGVLNPKTPEDKALHALNEKLTADERVENFLIPLRDGIQIVQKL